MSFNFLNQGQTSDAANKVSPIDTFIDPVSKIRVSNPANLIDTDFEYGLQPTKWETVEIINNTPAFFSKSGDTTISDITGVTTNGGTREITVTTAFPHLLAVGIPIRVSGTKSVTADGSYIINATPTPTTFTYLSRANQPETISIFDLYTSIITGEFFQGSQISISDAEGITTDGVGPNSTLTVTTANRHGFGPLTPFYFLNLNSTVSQEFESQNSTSLSFDPTNSATAQAFDGSNTLLQTPIDISNSATSSIIQSSISSTDPGNGTITLNQNGAAWDVVKEGDPVYYDVNIGSGYFQANPRGVVFVKNILVPEASPELVTFEVSDLPNGTSLPVLANMTGFFQIADQAKTFAGNNSEPENQITINLLEGSEYVFDGGNQGFDGDADIDFSGSPPSNQGTVVGYTGTNVTLFTAEGNLDYYVGAMVLYETDGAPATGLSENTTYFVTSFSAGASAGLFNITVSELPGENASNIDISGGSGTQTFRKIGVSVDKDIVHVRESYFEKNDLLEYSYPSETISDNFSADEEKNFYIVSEAYDEHNYKLQADVFTPTLAIGGDIISTTFADGRTWRIHEFTSTGSSNFEVVQAGTEPLVEYLVLGGGGGAGHDDAGGGGGGGMLEGSTTITQQSYPVVVGAGGARAQVGTTNNGSNGGNSSIFGITALGGGGGSNQTRDANDGGSGGGAGHWGASNRQSRGGSGTPGQGFDGGDSHTSSGGDWAAGGGGGAGQAGTRGINGSNATGKGGDGRQSSITGTATYYGGGGGGQSRRLRVSGGLGGGGFAGTEGGNATAGTDGLGGGGGGGGNSTTSRLGARGGSGRVIVRYPISSSDGDGVTTASGGTITSTEQNGVIYVVHTFTSNGTFEVENIGSIVGADSAEYLILAGGGGGSTDDAGGGGAGGMLEGSTNIEVGTYNVVVGQGGPRTPAGSSANGSNGGNSSVFGITATGGGGGGFQGRNGNNGGSGGGGGHFPSAGGQGIAGQGFNGGRGHTSSGGDWAAGGGGGAGQAGANGVQGSNDTGKGGDGRQSSITGTATYYGGGGGGQSRRLRVQGGLGGGGAAGTESVGANNGVDGLGGGGGGGGNSNNSRIGGNGGDGVVIIRYPIAYVEQ